MTRTGDKFLTVKDWFANKVANELGKNITMCDVFAILKETEMSQEQLNLMMILITSYVHTNAFLWYGNFLDRDKREFSAVGKNQRGNKTIVFRPFQNQLYATSVGRHRSPEGVFQVRGHFRRYQTGKVIWIDGYLKGVDTIEN